MVTICFIFTILTYQWDTMRVKNRHKKRDVKGKDGKLNAYELAKLKEKMAKFPGPCIDPETGKLYIPYGTECKCLKCLHTWTRRDYSLIKNETAIRCPRCTNRNILIGDTKLKDLINQNNEILKADSITQSSDSMGKKLKVKNDEKKPKELKQDEPEKIEQSPDNKPDSDMAEKYKKAKEEGVESSPMEISFEGESFELPEPGKDELPPVKLLPMPITDAQKGSESKDRQINHHIPQKPSFGSKTIDGSDILAWDQEAVAQASRTVTSLITFLGEKIAQEDSPPELVNMVSESLAMVLWQNKHLLEASKYVSLVILAIAVGRYLVWAFETRGRKAREGKQTKTGNTTVQTTG